nr:hypothetical protein [Gemmatimonadota bacterium]
MFVAALVATAAPARAQSIGPTAVSDAEYLERIHRDTIRTRRLLADSVFVAGLGSIAVGGALIVPSGDDQAWRYAGINTAIFGVVNTIVGLLALHGIAAEEDTWESDAGLAARRTPEGLTRARIHAAVDERRESVGHAINLGLDGAYLGVAGTAIVASQLGVDHSKRWLASGVAVGVQALFLVGIDFIGLARSQTYHRAFLESLLPTLAITPTATGSGTETRI